MEMMYELNVSPLGEIYEATPAKNNNNVIKEEEEGEEEDRDLKGKGRSKKGNKKTPTEELRYCERTSTPMTTQSACCNDPVRRRLGNTRDVEPWMTPNHPKSKAELIASDPGIWKIPDFLDQSIVQRMLETFTNDERFERCIGGAHNHLKCKQCFKLSSSNSLDADEVELVQELLKKLQTLWPSENQQPDYLYVQRTEGDCDATLVHKDFSDHDLSKSPTVTVAFSLSDGGAGVFFPEIDVIVPPEAGMALTWLNVHEDGSYNPAASHGVQSTPKDGGIRYSITYRIILSDEEMIAVEARKK
jgi:hypothetical protein